MTVTMLERCYVIILYIICHINISCTSGHKCTSSVQSLHIKGSVWKGIFFQDKWALSCLFVVLNNDIIPNAIQLLFEHHYLNQWSLRLHKWPSLPHPTPPPWKHLNGDISVSLFSLVSLVFFTESELLFIDIGMSRKAANIIRFH